MVQGGHLKPTKLMYKVNETVHLECSTGAFVYTGNQLLLSDSSSLNRSCLPNGTWSGPQWACGHPTKSSQGGIHFVLCNLKGLYNPCCIT